MLLRLLPLFVFLAARWAARHERRILRLGVPLSPESLADAARMGVAQPEKIRLMEVDRIPLLNGTPVRWLARVVPQLSADTVGLSLRYGIYIRTRYRGNRQLIAHECVHTGQYERCGGLAAFLRAYFSECLTHGYPGAAMEQEAIHRAGELS